MTDEAKAPKKPGRPAKNPGEGKRPTITFRCRGPLHERIQSSAREADRSVSEEVETRLDKSYLAEDQYSENHTAMVSVAKSIILDILHDQVGGKHNFNAGQRFAHVLKFHQAEADAKFKSEEPWYFDSDKKEYVTNRVIGVVKFIIDELAGEIDPEEAEKRRKASDGALLRLGRDAGLSGLGQVAPESSVTLGPLGHPRSSGEGDAGE